MRSRTSTTISRTPGGCALDKWYGERLATGAPWRDWAPWGPLPLSRGEDGVQHGWKRGSSFLDLSTSEEDNGQGSRCPRSTEWYCSRITDVFVAPTGSVPVSPGRGGVGVIVIRRARNPASASDPSRCSLVTAH